MGLTFLYKIIDNNHKIIETILKMFDEHLENIEMKSENEFIVSYTDHRKVEVSDKELYYMLSNGTTKGLGLFTFVVYKTDVNYESLMNFKKELMK